MPVHNPPPASGGSSITTDAEGYVHIPGLPPIKIPIEVLESGAVRTAIIVKDELASKERVPAEAIDAS